MVLGMSLSTFTAIHVLISLIGIGSGVVVAYGLVVGKPLPGLTAIFLTFTVLTSLTGFLFPIEHLTPGLIVGTLSLVVLAGAIVGRYAMHLAGIGRGLYVVCATIAFYFNCFVLVAQSFAKVPALHALAPTQKEPPFAITQGIVLVIFVVIGIFGIKNFHVAPQRESLKRAA